MPDNILTIQSDDLFEIILNRPQKKNALNWDMLKAIEASIEQAEKSPGARVILIHSKNRGFSTGVDLSAFPQLPQIFGENWERRIPSIVSAFQSILNKVAQCHLPTIALLRGYALGLGLELALACDFRIAAKHTKLGLPETRLGIIPDVGGTTRLTHLIGPGKAKELIMTGKIIDAELAMRWGLINYAVPARELREKSESLAEELTLSSPLAVSAAKRVINNLGNIKSGLELEALAQNTLLQSEDFQIGLSSMLSKTPPEWLGK